MAATVGRWTPGEDWASLRALVDRGGVLAIPTESSYGLAVDPRNRSAVDAIFRIKGRPRGQPLPVVAASLEQLTVLDVVVPADGLGGLERAWPGPLSVLLACPAGLPAAAGSGRVAVRIPGNGELRRLLGALGLPLTATSANLSGESPVLGVDALEPLLAGEDAMIVDGGRLPGGAPSTLVAIEAGRGVILREGRLSRRDLEGLAPELFSAEAVEIPVDESR